MKERIQFLPGLGQPRRSGSFLGRRCVSPYLLDTNVALGAVTDPGALSRPVRTAVLRGRGILSVVAYWEVLLKTMKGNPNVGDPRVCWRDTLEQLAATPLALRPEHIAGAYNLPPLHKDPFDLVLIAQASVEGLALVTTDGDILGYASSRLRIVS